MDGYQSHARTGVTEPCQDGCHRAMPGRCTTWTRAYGTVSNLVELVKLVNPGQSGQSRSGLVMPGLVMPGLVMPGLVWSCLAWSILVMVNPRSENSVDS